MFFFHLPKVGVNLHQRIKFVKGIVIKAAAYSGYLETANEMPQQQNLEIFAQ